MLIPGAVLRHPAFKALTLTQRGAFFMLLLYMWETGSLREDSLPVLSELGADWPGHAAALRPLFEVRRGKWSLGWLSRYAKRVQTKRDSGHFGAVATNSKRKQLRESAGGTVPSRSGSDSASGSPSKKKDPVAIATKTNTSTGAMFTAEESAPPDEAGKALADASVEAVRKMVQSEADSDPEAPA
jgi:uncharacterized protein YdaU (DUF1376 family)